MTSDIVCAFSPSICHEVIALDAIIIYFNGRQVISNFICCNHRMCDVPDGLYFGYFV